MNKKLQTSWKQEVIAENNFIHFGRYVLYGKTDEHATHLWIKGVGDTTWVRKAACDCYYSGLNGSGYD